MTNQRRRLVPVWLACMVVTVVLAAVVLAAGQQGGVPGAIRVRITLVPVNVVVTDKDDRPVTDLTKDEFIVTENGVRQAISHFERQTLTPQAAESVVGQPTQLRKVPAAELTSESKRTFLIVLGRGRLQAPSKGVDGLIHFVRAELLPQDLVAVMAYDRATDFSTDHERAAQLLERFKRYHEGIEGKMALRFSGLAAIYGSGEIPKGLRADIAKVFDAPGAPGSRQVPPGRITGAAILAQDARDVTETLQRQDVAAASSSVVSPFDRLQADAQTDLPFDDFVSRNRQTMQDVQNIYTAIEYLRYMEGEKHLLFVTEQGLFLPRLEHDTSLAAMANDARVTIDTFQTGGVATTGEMNASSSFSAENPRLGSMARNGAAAGNLSAAQRRNTGFSQMMALASLRNISRLTGGRSSIHADVPTSLSRLDELTRSEYLLGYYPGNTKWDGKYRQIAVRVTRPGLKVSFRRGYYARQSLQPFDRKVFLSYSRIAAAGQYDQELKDIKVKARASAVPNTPGAEAEAQLDVLIDVSRVPFVEEGGLHKAMLQVTTFYGDGRGRFLGDVWQELALNLKPETWQRVTKDGVPFSTRVPLKASEQTFKVVVYSYEADKVGSAMFKLK